MVKYCRAYWTQNMWPKIVLLYLGAISVCVILSIIMIINVEGHGNHLTGTQSELAIIGQVHLGMGMICRYIDENDNGKPDRVMVIVFIDNSTHILFDDTYPKFIKEYGDHGRY